MQPWLLSARGPMGEALSNESTSQYISLSSKMTNVYKFNTLGYILRWQISTFHRVGLRRVVYDAKYNTKHNYHNDYK